MTGLNRVQTEASLLIADGAERFAILVLAALITKFEVVGEDEIFVWVQVDFILNVLLIEERLCPAFGALEAVRTLPVAGGHLD